MALDIFPREEKGGGLISKCDERTWLRRERRELNEEEKKTERERRKVRWDPRNEGPRSQGVKVRSDVRLAKIRESPKQTKGGTDGVSSRCCREPLLFPCVPRLPLSKSSSSLLMWRAEPER